MLSAGMIWKQFLAMSDRIMSSVVFRGSSAAERSALDREGAGSSPAPGPILRWINDRAYANLKSITNLPGVNPLYAAFQIAKALGPGEEHGDPATRARAEEKAAKWETVLSRISSLVRGIWLEDPA